MSRKRKRSKLQIVMLMLIGMTKMMILSRKTKINQKIKLLKFLMGMLMIKMFRNNKKKTKKIKKQWVVIMLHVEGDSMRKVRVRISIGMPLTMGKNKWIKQRRYSRKNKWKKLPCQ